MLCSALPWVLKLGIQKVQNFKITNFQQRSQTSLKSDVGLSSTSDSKRAIKMRTFVSFEAVKLHSALTVVMMFVRYLITTVELHLKLLNVFLPAPGFFRKIHRKSQHIQLSCTLAEGSVAVAEPTLQDGLSDQQLQKVGINMRSFHPHGNSL